MALHHVHSFNDLYSEVLEQWSPHRDLAVSEVRVQKTQLVADLETPVWLRGGQYEGAGRLADDHMDMDSSPLVFNEACGMSHHRKGALRKA